MAFLTLSDFESLIKIDNLQSIIETDTIILDLVFTETISQVESFLIDRYDTIEIFNKTGDNRNAFLVKLCKHIALYELYKRLPKSKMPEIRAKDNSDALEFLVRLADGEQSLPLPRKIEPDNKIRYGFATPPRLD